ncbi:hypothetical protein PFISCL1PPCAC_4763, partial [Pristionchus fissidentatus]
ADWNEDWVEIVLACYKKLTIHRIKLNLLKEHSLNEGICLLGSLAEDLATRIKPDEIELNLDNGCPRELLLRVAEVASKIFIHELGTTEEVEIWALLILEMLSKRCRMLVIDGNIKLNAAGADHFVREITSLEKHIIFSIRVEGFEEIKFKSGKFNVIVQNYVNNQGETKTWLCIRHEEI